MLTREIAEEIVKQTTIRLHRNINIMDESGVIIASGDRKRMDTAHFGAMEVLRTGKPLLIYEKNSHQWEGARPGINLPIEFQQKIIGVIGITGNPDEMLEFSELVKMITEMMIQQSFMIEQLEWKQRLKELVFEDLRKGSSNIESIKQRLNLIGVKLEPPYQVSTVEVDSDKFHPRELVQVLEGYFEPHRTLAGILSTNRLFLLNSYLSEKKVKEKLLTVIDRLHAKGIFIRIGLGSYVDSASYIGNSYEESLSALALGSKDQHFVLYSDIESKLLLDQVDSWYKQQFSERILGNMSEKLMETLESFFLNDLNLSETAKSLYIHRNSLLYRMKKIKEITGYDPQKFHHATTLQIAIWLDQIVKMVK